jgi:hypothetical protein
MKKEKMKTKMKILMKMEVMKLKTTRLELLEQMRSMSQNVKTMKRRMMMKKKSIHLTTNLSMETSILSFRLTRKVVMLHEGQGRHWQVWFHIAKN